MEEYKDCLSCKFEPEWKRESPIGENRAGYCKEDISFFDRLKILKIDDAPYCWSLDRWSGFGYCPAWVAKDEEE